MNREEFSQLIKALRKECRDENLKSLTQEELASQTGLSVRTINRLEAGDETIKLKGDDLSKLAHALRLTSGERKEFFLAATEIENSKLTLEHYNPTDVLNDLFEKLKIVCLPAFISDTYADIIAVNSAMFSLYSFNPLDLNDVADRSPLFNILRFFFSPEFEKQQNMMKNWNNVVFQNIMHFRTYSLRYRSTPYFSKLLSASRKYPSFNRCWRDVYWNEKDHIIDGGDFQFSSPIWGNLEYIVPIYTVLTVHGYLFLSVYTPTNLETLKAFNSIVEQVGTDAYRLATWPEKPGV